MGYKLGQIIYFKVLEIYVSLKTRMAHVFRVTKISNSYGFFRKLKIVYVIQYLLFEVFFL